MPRLRWGRPRGGQKAPTRRRSSGADARRQLRTTGALPRQRQTLAVHPRAVRRRADPHPQHHSSARHSVSSLLESGRWPRSLDGRVCRTRLPRGRAGAARTMARIVFAPVEGTSRAMWACRFAQARKHRCGPRPLPRVWPRGEPRSAAQRPCRGRGSDARRRAGTVGTVSRSRPSVALPARAVRRCSEPDSHQHQAKAGRCLECAGRAAAVRLLMPEEDSV